MNGNMRPVLVTWTPAVLVCLVAIGYTTIVPGHQRTQLIVNTTSKLFRLIPILNREGGSHEAAAVKLGIRMALISNNLSPKFPLGVGDVHTSNIAEVVLEMRSGYSRTVTDLFGGYVVHYSESEFDANDMQSDGERTCNAFETTIDGVKATWLLASSMNEAQNKTESPTLLYAHGGGFVAGGGNESLPVACALAWFWDIRVLAVDFRQPPQHPLTRSYEDYIRVYRHFTDLSKRFIFFGSGSGGNVAFSSLLRLRSLGTYMPAATVLISPILDLTSAFHREDGKEMGLSIDERDISFYANVSVGGYSISSDSSSSKGGEEVRRFVTEGEMEEYYQLLSLVSPYHHNPIAVGPVAMFWEQSEVSGLSNSYLWNEMRKVGTRKAYTQRSGLFHQYPMFYDYIPEARIDMVKAKDFALGLVKEYENKS